MSAKKKTGKVIGILAVILTIMIAFIFIVFYLPLKKYIDATPKVTPISQVEIRVGDTVQVSDLFNVECKGDYTVKMSVSEKGYSVIQMSKDGQSFVANGAAEEVVIYVNARGSNAESVGATNTITIR